MIIHPRESDAYKSETSYSSILSKRARSVIEQTYLSQQVLGRSPGAHRGVPGTPGSQYSHRSTGFYALDNALASTQGNGWYQYMLQASCILTYSLGSQMVV